MFDVTAVFDESNLLQREVFENVAVCLIIESLDIAECSMRACSPSIAKYDSLMLLKNEAHHQAVIAQLVARRSHNPKVVSSILTHRI